jgi:hypothetical protein
LENRRVGKCKYGKSKYGIARVEIASTENTSTEMIRHSQYKIIIMVDGSDGCIIRRRLYIELSMAPNATAVTASPMAHDSS